MEEAVAHIAEAVAPGSVGGSAAAAVAGPQPPPPGSRLDGVAEAVSLIHERQAKMQAQLDELHDMLYQVLKAKPVAVSADL